jgi:predicted hydrocarbon binding protein
MVLKVVVELELDELTEETLEVEIEVLEVEAEVVEVEDREEEEDEPDGFQPQG